MLAEIRKVFAEMLDPERCRNLAAPGEVNDFICERKCFCPHALHDTSDPTSNQESIDEIN